MLKRLPSGELGNWFKKVPSFVRAFFLLTTIKGFIMSPSEYAVAVRRTVSPFFYPECVDGQALELALSDFVAASKRLDIFKKAAYYGKGESVEQPLQFTGNKDYLHAVLGICTEAGELAENIMNGLEVRNCNGLSE